MSNIIFITGMSGSGKSTISRGVAEHFPQALHLDVDQLRGMMVTGLARPGSQPDIVTEERVKQLQLARSSATYDVFVKNTPSATATWKRCRKRTGSCWTQATGRLSKRFMRSWRGSAQPIVLSWLLPKRGAGK